MLIRNSVFAYVSRNNGNGPEFLVATRTKNDPYNGLLVIPCGAVEPGEDYLEAAMRETLEEGGGIRTYPRSSRIVSPRKRIVAERKVAGWTRGDLFYLFQRGNMFVYRAPIVNLYPVDPNEEPDQEIARLNGYDAINPGYMSLDEAVERRSHFMPACRPAIDAILAHEMGQRNGDSLPNPFSFP